VTDDLERQLAAYEVWLARQPLASNTRRAYLLQVRQYGAYLTTQPSQDGDPLHHPFARDYAVRDYKTYLKTQGKVKSASVNLGLAAIDHFSLFLGLDQPRVKREDLPAQSPRSLNQRNKKPFYVRLSALPLFEIKLLRDSSSTRDYVWVNVQS
jgi:hypothetical protein